MARKPDFDIAHRVRELRRHQKDYYEGHPTIPDAEFDILESELREVVPNHQYFKTPGGAKIPNTTTVKHVVPMKSLDKVKEVLEVFTWLKRIDMPPSSLLCGMPKVDGISATIKYDKNGYFNYAATRGPDGTEGSIIPYPEEIQGIPSRIPYRDSELESRGEFYLPKHLKTTNPHFVDRSLRNYCYGLLSREEKTEELKYVNFVAYGLVGGKDILGGPVSMDSLLEYLGGVFPNTVPHELLSVVHLPGLNITTVDKYIKKYLETYRNEWPYESDGIVLTIDNAMQHKVIDKFMGGAKKYHHYSLAVKPPAQFEQTTTLAIIYKVSKQGRIIPVLIFVPVMIGGVEVTNATLNNAMTVKELGLKIGDQVLIERANDVIPRLKEVLGGGVEEFKLPTNCPSCNSTLEWDSRHLVCTNKSCKGRHIALINHWVERCDIKDVGEKVIEDLYNCGAVKSIPDLYTVDLDAVLSTLPGYSSGGSRITKINEAIQATKGMTEFDIISRIGISGIGDQMLKKYEIRGISDLLKYQKDSDYKYAAEKSLNEWITKPENLTMLMSLVSILKPMKIMSINSVPSKHTIFCITGSFPKSRDVIIDELEAKGYEFSNNVTSRTTCLIQGEASGGAKLERAQSLGIPIVYSVEAFEKMFP